MEGTEFARITGSYRTAFIGSWELVSQDLAGNSSTIRLYGTFRYGGGDKVNSDYSSFTLGGKLIASGDYHYKPGDYQLGTTDIKVYHNDDGSFPSQTIYIKASSYHMSGETYGVISGVESIPRASTVSASDFSLEDGINYTIKSASSSFFHQIHLYKGDTWITSTQTSQLSGTLTPSEVQTANLYQYIPNDIVLPLRLQCITFTANSAQVGDHWINISAKVDYSRCQPTFSSFSYQDENTAITAVTGDNQILVSGQSNLSATISAAQKAVGRKGATIKKYILECGGQSKEAPYSANGNVQMSISNITSGTVKVTAVDSRGLKTTATKTATLIPYTPPVIRSSRLLRVNGVEETVNLDLSAQIYSNNIGQTANAVQSISYRYRRTGTNDWITGSTAIPPGTSVSQAIAGDIDAGFTMARSYDVEVTVRDALAAATVSLPVTSGVPVMDMYRKEDQVGVSIGALYDHEAGGMLQMAGVPFLESGSNTNGNWLKFYDGTMICTKKVPYTSNITTGEGGMYYGTRVSLGRYAQPFIAQPYIHVSLSGPSSGMPDTVKDAGAADIGTINICRATSHTATDITVNIVAIGRWK